MASPRAAGIALTLVAVAVAASMVEILVFDRPGPATRLTVLVFGGLTLVAGTLAAVGVVVRTHHLLRLLSTSRTETADDLDPGTRWVDLVGVAEPAGDTVTTARGGEAIAGTVRIGVRERFSGLAWPSVRTRSPVEATDLTAFSLAGTARGAPVDGWRVVGGAVDDLSAADLRPTEGSRADPEREPLRTFLVRHGVDPDADAFEGRVFEHFVRLREATVESGRQVRLFGRVRVRREGSTTVLRPAGRFECDVLLSAGSRGPIWDRHLRRAVRLLVAAPLSLAVAALLFEYAI